VDYLVITAAVFFIAKFVWKRLGPIRKPAIVRPKKAPHV